MRIVFILILISCCLIMNTAFADEMSESKEETMKELIQTVKELKATVEAQQKEINYLKEVLPQSANLSEKAASVTTIAPVSQPSSVSPAGAATQEQIQEINTKVDKVVEAQKKTLMSEFNPSIGLVGETIFSYRSQRIQQNRQ